MRSLRLVEPVLIWPALVATAMSAMVASSVSPATMAEMSSCICCAGQLDGVEGFGQRTDLIDLHQNAVGDVLLVPFCSRMGWSAKKIVADQLPCAPVLW